MTRSGCGRRASGSGCWTRRTRSCAERRHICRSRRSRNDLPAGPRPCRRRDPRRGDLPGPRILSAGILQVAHRPVLQRDWDQAHLTNAASDTHRDDPAFGYGFTADEFRDAGLLRRRGGSGLLTRPAHWVTGSDESMSMRSGSGFSQIGSLHRPARAPPALPVGVVPARRPRRSDDPAGTASGAGSRRGRQHC